jgi:hypothetical protein
LAGETEVVGENLPQCNFDHINPEWSEVWSKLGHRGRKTVTNRLSYGTALANRVAQVAKMSSLLRNLSSLSCYKKNPPLYSEPD